MGKTAIEWATDVWNPTTGCEKVSTGCKRCYAKTLHDRRHAAHQAGKVTARQYAHAFEAVQMLPERLAMPLGWRDPRTVFVNSVSDLFHVAVTDEFLARVFAVMAVTPQHRYLVLTKRPDRMRDFTRGLLTPISVQAAVGALADRAQLPTRLLARATTLASGILPWPLPNVWLGTSVEDQRAAEQRVPALLEAEAAVRWISAEPLLGPVDLRNIELPGTDGATMDALGTRLHEPVRSPRRVRWVVAGGETGEGARPMHPEWARDLRDDCAAAGAAFFFKQHGDWIAEDQVQWLSERHQHYAIGAEHRHLRAGCAHPILAFRVGKARAGRVLDGRTWDDYPATEAR